jgi:urea transporter
MSTLPSRWAAVLSAMAGAIGWFGVSALGHRREAWDSELYWSWFFPSLAVVVLGLGYFSPTKAWRWGFIPFLAQAVVAFVQDPGGSLLPLGLVMFGIFGAIAALPAMLGAAARRRVEHRPAP